MTTSNREKILLRTVDGEMVEVYAQTIKDVAHRAFDKVYGFPLSAIAKARKILLGVGFKTTEVDKALPLLLELAAKTPEARNIVKRVNKVD